MSEEMRDAHFAAITERIADAIEHALAEHTTNPRTSIERRSVEETDAGRRVANADRRHAASPARP